MKFDDVQTWGDFRGKKELLKHLAGERLTLKQAVLAECYSCNAGYFDGRVDCEASDCPLYGHMPYRKNKIKRPRSEKQQAAAAKLGFLGGERNKKVAL